MTEYTITLKDVNDTLTNKLDQVTNAVHSLELAVSKLEPVTQMGADHEIRLRALERFRWALFGSAGLFGSTAGIVTDLVLRAAGHK